MRVPVIALPGGIAPAALRYAPLKAAVGDEADFHFKDLEVYAGDAPPSGYSVATEVDALGRFADSLGLRRFHLVSYSGGGFVSLALAGAHPGRLLSLALFEPARLPGRLTAEESVFDRRLRQGLAGLSGPESMRAFATLQVREGVDVPPPSGPPAPWMRTRAAGLAAMMRAFAEYPFVRECLRGCAFPVFLGYGDLSSEKEEVQASILAGLLPDIRIQRFKGIHHFVPPQRIYTAEHVEAIRELWARAQTIVAA